MKRVISAIIAIVLIGSVSSSGYGKDVKVIEMTYSNNSPAKSGGNIFFEQVYLPKINKEIAEYGYRLDVTMYHASSLYKYQDQVNALEKGLIDITNFICNWEEARAPLHQVLYLPMTGFSPQSHSKIWFDLQENIPEFGREFSKYQELFHISTTPGIFNMNKERRVPADFKGVKVAATGVTADFFKSIGATPLRIDAPDWYSALDRGMIDVLPLGAFLINMWKIDEVAKVHVIPTGDALTWTSLSYILNRRSFEKLPKEVQKVILNNVEWASAEVTKIDDQNTIRSIEKFQKEGNTVVNLTPEEMKLWHSEALIVHKKWIGDMESKGLPGQQVYDETKRLIKEYRNL